MVFGLTKSCLNHQGSVGYGWFKKSELQVTQLINVLENDYWSPFSVFLEDGEVYNLSSGKKYEGNVQDLLDIKNQGQ